MILFRKKDGMMKKLLKILGILGIVLTGFVVIAAGYVAYVFLDYHRIGDQILTASGDAAAGAAGAPYSVVSYNIGFGAYEADYGFFMDGGTQSWAWSRERLDANLRRIAAFLEEQDADFYLVQEVDIDSTRSYHFDERTYLAPLETGRAVTFAQNYDSPFLFYPLLQPHGASRSGLVTYSRCPVTFARRVALPIEEGLTKLLDLDRCYSKNRVEVPGGELVLYNLHLSAYTSDGTIATVQLRQLLADMETEYQAGNWCVAGGDFNKDILGDSSVWFGASDIAYTWAQPIPEGTFDGYHVSLVAPLDKENPVPSCRNADGPYHAGQYVLTVDGFLVSANVTVAEAAVLDTGFAFSDHNPVRMTFTLD